MLPYIAEPKDTFGDTPLHTAALNGYLDVVKVLMLQNINTEPRNNILKTPLHYAAQHGHLEVVKYLMNEIKMTNKGKCHLQLFYFIF